MKGRLFGKIAIVTGAGRGIGRAEALALAAEGARVLVNDLGCDLDGQGASMSPAEEVVAEIRRMGGEALANCDTVATVQGGENVIRAAIDGFGGLDILVNNAGVMRDRMIFNMSEDDWGLVMRVNLDGHFNCTKAACVWFRKQWKEQGKGGRIINTSSTAGLGYIGQANYSAAKEGIVGFTRSVALDMARYGVTCNAIRPSAATRMSTGPQAKAGWEAAGLGDLWERRDKLSPEAVAPLVTYLATDEAAHISGRVFRVLEGEIGIYSQPIVVKSIHKTGRWTLTELSDLVPKRLVDGTAATGESRVRRGRPTGYEFSDFDVVE